MKIIDLLIIGAGPAGLTAGLYAARGGLETVIAEKLMPGGQMATSSLIENYPGFPDGIDGASLAMQMQQQAEKAGARIWYDPVMALKKQDGLFYADVSGHSEPVCARAVILALGGQPRPLGVEGEDSLRGRGVSYCATCDGMLYRGKAVLVWGLSPEAAGEANFLASIGCRVRFVAAKRPEALDAAIEFLPGSLQGVGGGMKLEWARVAGQQLAADGVFILRAAIAPDTLLPGLSLANGFVTVNRSMATNLPGVFAAGDVTGAPLQVAKAVGEGLIAGLSAADHLSASGV